MHVISTEDPQPFAATIFVTSAASNILRYSNRYKPTFVPVLRGRLRPGQTEFATKAAYKLALHLQLLLGHMTGNRAAIEHEQRVLDGANAATTLFWQRRQGPKIVVDFEAYTG